MSELEVFPSKRRCIDGAEVLTYKKIGEEENISQDTSELLKINKENLQFRNNVKNISTNSVEKCLNSVLFTIDGEKLIREDIAT